jgi:hypothetical protein
VDEWLSFIASLPEATRQRIATATQEQAARDNMASMRRLVPEGGRTAMEPEYPLTGMMGSILGSVKDAATLPGRALYGEVPRADEMPQGEAVGEALNMAGMVSLPALRGGRAANTVSMSGASDGPGIKAYHGSPHDFDRFSLDKIGTGEGAQAYGHGLYFAESEGVAKSYRDGLSKWNPQIDGRPVIDMWADGTLNQKIVEMTGLPRSDAISAGNWVAESVRSGRPLSQILDEKAEAARRIYPPEIAAGEAARIAAIGEKVKGIAPETHSGKMYEVNIKANPDDFLDWDKPFKEQPENVRKALGPRIDKLRQAGATVGDDTDGSMLWRVAHPQPGVDELDFSRPLPLQATSRLKEAGIPGIRYLDQGSRGTGEGSRNYVVFDDSMIEILRKYGLLGPLGLGAGAAAVGTNDGT